MDHSVDEWRVGTIEGNLAERARRVAESVLVVLVVHRGDQMDQRE